MELDSGITVTIGSCPDPIDEETDSETEPEEVLPGIDEEEIDEPEIDLPDY